MSAAVSHSAELRCVDEAPDEPDVIGDAERRCQRGELAPVRLALAPDQLGMGRAHDDVQRGRVGLDDGGHRRDGRFVALARPEQSEAQDDRAAFQSQLGLDAVGCHERQARDAVWHDLQAGWVDAVRAGQQCRRRGGHHDGRRDRADELAQDASLRRSRMLQDRVQRGDDRRAEGLDEVEDVRPVAATPDAVLMLDGDDIDRSRVDPARGAQVVRRMIATRSDDGPPSG